MNQYGKKHPGSGGATKRPPSGGAAPHPMPNDILITEPVIEIRRVVVPNGFVRDILGCPPKTVERDVVVGQKVIGKNYR